MTDKIPVDEPTVFVIDDDEAICEALTWLFKSVQLNVETYNSAHEFLDHFDKNRKGCILLDIRMPGMSGLELQEKLNALGNWLPVIFITGHGDVPMAVRALKAGAVDFILKPFNSQLLLEQVQKAILHNNRMQEDYIRIDKVAACYSSLTPRELEVFEKVINGKLNKEIAYELNISASTVELHRARVMQKMKAKSLAELVKFKLMLEKHQVEA